VLPSVHTNGTVRPAASLLLRYRFFFLLHVRYWFWITSPRHPNPRSGNRCRRLFSIAFKTSRCYPKSISTFPTTVVFSLAHPSGFRPQNTAKIASILLPRSPSNAETPPDAQPPCSPSQPNSQASPSSSASSRHPRRSLTALFVTIEGPQMSSSLSFGAGPFNSNVRLSISSSPQPSLSSSDGSMRTPTFDGSFRDNRTVSDEIVPKIEELDVDLGDVKVAPLLDDLPLSPTRIEKKRPRGRPRKHPPISPSAITKLTNSRCKTGCQTCRKRKKKCDEGKPTCN